MNQKPIIIWEKWLDPYQVDPDDDWPGAFGSFESDEVKQKIHRQNNGEDVDLTEEDISLLKSEDTPIKNGIKVLATPMGVIPIAEHSSPGKVFNMWTMHLNVRITTKLASIIEDTPGIETLDIFTPYRARISIGKAFDSQNVKQEVAKRLTDFIAE